MSPLLPWMLAAVAALLPSYQIRFALFGIPTTALEVLVLLTIAVGTVNIILNQKITSYQLPVTSYRWCAAITLFLIAGSISVLVAPDTRAALGLWKAYIIEPIALFFIATLALKTNEDRRRVVIGVACSGLFVALVAIWQKFSPDGILGLWPIYRSASNMEWYTEETRRVTGVYPFPNAVGLLLAPIAVLLRGVLLHSVRRFTDGRRTIDKKQLALFIALTIASSLMTLAVFWARSHGGLVGIAAGIVVLGLLSQHWRRVTIQMLSLIVILLLVSIPLRSLVIEEFGGADPSIGIRVKQYKETWRCLIASPRTFLLGGGLSGYKQLVAPCHKSKAIEIYQYPHDIFLNFWSEMGLLGLGSFCAIVVLYYRRGLLFIFGERRRMRAHETDIVHPNATALPIALLGAMTTLLVHGLVDVPYFKNDLAILFWLLVALLLTATASQQRAVHDASR